MNPEQEWVLFARGAELWVHEENKLYAWRDVQCVRAELAGPFPGHLDRLARARQEWRSGSGRERRCLGRRLRQRLQGKTVAVSKATTHDTLVKANWLQMMSTHLPFNVPWLIRILAGTIAVAPLACLLDLQSIDHVVLAHIPTACYFGHVIAFLTGTPNLLKNKQGLKLVRGIDHILVQTRCYRPGTPMKNIRLPRGIGQCTLLLVVLASFQRPLEIPKGPLTRLKKGLADSVPWLSASSFRLLRKDGKLAHIPEVVVES
jgi:hypothetical protein